MKMTEMGNFDFSEMGLIGGHLSLAPLYEVY